MRENKTFRHLYFTTSEPRKYCPKCKKLYLVNEKGNVKTGGFLPITSSTKTEICPVCLHPEKYQYETAKCLDCDKYFIYKSIENRPYCRVCERNHKDKWWKK